MHPEATGCQEHKANKWNLRPDSVKPDAAAEQACNPQRTRTLTQRHDWRCLLTAPCEPGPLPRRGGAMGMESVAVYSVDELPALRIMEARLDPRQPMSSRNDSKQRLNPCLVSNNMALLKSPSPLMSPPWGQLGFKQGAALLDMEITPRVDEAQQVRPSQLQGDVVKGIETMPDPDPVAAALGFDHVPGHGQGLD
ncbi:hypothetical protein G6O67_003379 [Ophiocordyceps sinensis]|uniref:Uncharacterized protein n=1 Tax=Ophiocordyceps sinensis TaxID=72228 RepID=A0A8H4PW77_9HYPO|nr:hypothetical protein G6O67_003379 [Ophiocordyceps sinensis]